MYFDSNTSPYQLNRPSYVPNANYYSNVSQFNYHNQVDSRSQQSKKAIFNRQLNIKFYESRVIQNQQQNSKFNQKVTFVRHQSTVSENGHGIQIERHSINQQKRQLMQKISNLENELIIKDSAIRRKDSQIDQMKKDRNARSSKNLVTFNHSQSQQLKNLKSEKQKIFFKLLETQNQNRELHEKIKNLQESYQYRRQERIFTQYSPYHQDLMDNQSKVIQHLKQQISTLQRAIKDKQQIIAQNKIKLDQIHNGYRIKLQQLQNNIRQKEYLNIVKTGISELNSKNIEFENLRQQLKNKTEMIRYLESKCRKLQNSQKTEYNFIDNIKYKTQNDNYQNKIVGLQQQIKKLQLNNDQLKKQIKDLQSQTQKKSIDYDIETFNKLKIEYQKLKLQVTNRNHYSNDSQYYKKLFDDKNGQRQSLNLKGKNQSLKMLQKELNQAKQKITQNEQKINTIQGIKQNYQKENLDLLNEIQISNKQMIKLKTKMKEDKDQSEIAFNKMKNHLQNMESKLKNLQYQKDNEIKTLTLSIATKDKDRQVFLKKVQLLQYNLAKKSQSMEIAKQNIKTLQLKNQSIMNQIKDLNTKIISKNIQLEQVRNKNSEYNQKIKQSIQEVDTIKKQNKLFQQQIKKLQTQIEIKIQVEKNYTLNYQNLNNELYLIQNQNTKLSKQLQRRINEYQKILNQKNNQLSQLKKKILEFDKEKTLLSVTLYNTQQQNRILDEKFIFLSKSEQDWSKKWEILAKEKQSLKQQLQKERIKSQKNQIQLSKMIQNSQENAKKVQFLSSKIVNLERESQLSLKRLKEITDIKNIYQNEILKGQSQNKLLTEKMKNLEITLNNITNQKLQIQFELKQKIAIRTEQQKKLQNNESIFLTVKEQVQTLKNNIKDLQINRQQLINQLNENKRLEMVASQKLYEQKLKKDEIEQAYKSLKDRYQELVETKQNIQYQLQNYKEHNQRIMRQINEFNSYIQKNKQEDNKNLLLYQKNAQQLIDQLSVNTQQVKLAQIIAHTFEELNYFLNKKIEELQIQNLKLKKQIDQKSEQKNSQANQIKSNYLQIIQQKDNQLESKVIIIKSIQKENKDLQNKYNQIKQQHQRIAVAMINLQSKNKSLENQNIQLISQIKDLQNYLKENSNQILQNSISDKVSYLLKFCIQELQKAIEINQQLVIDQNQRQEVYLSVKNNLQSLYQELLSLKTNNGQQNNQYGQKNSNISIATLYYEQYLQVLELFGVDPDNQDHHTVLISQVNNFRESIKMLVDRVNQLQNNIIICQRQNKILIKQNNLIKNENRIIRQKYIRNQEIINQLNEMIVKSKFNTLNKKIQLNFNEEFLFKYPNNIMNTLQMEQQKLSQ